MTQKSWIPPKSRTFPNFKWEEHACLPKFRHVPPPPVLWPSHVYISTLVGLLIFDFVKIKVMGQISVYLLRIPSLHYLAEIGLPCVWDHLKSNFAHFLGSLKSPGSLKVLDSLEVSTNPRYPCIHFWFNNSVQSSSINYTTLQCYKKQV